VRAAPATDVGQIAPYTAAKRALLKNTSLRDGMGTHALASLAAGTVATTACAPFDVLKSRIQAASAGGGSSVSSSLLPSFCQSSALLNSSVAELGAGRIERFERRRAAVPDEGVDAGLVKTDVSFLIPLQFPFQVRC